MEQGMGWKAQAIPKEQEENLLAEIFVLFNHHSLLCSALIYVAWVQRGALFPCSGANALNREIQREAKRFPSEARCFKPAQKYFALFFKKGTQSKEVWEA